MRILMITKTCTLVCVCSPFLFTSSGKEHRQMKIMLFKMAFKQPVFFFVLVLSLVFWVQTEAKPGVNENVKVGVNGKQIIAAEHPDHLDGVLRITGNISIYFQWHSTRLNLVNFE